MKMDLPADEDMGFQMAPMIDAVFLLIVFFISASYISERDRISVDIPVADQSVVAREPGSRAVINIRRDGTIFAGSQPVEVAELPDLLAAIREDNPATKVYIRADREVQHRAVRQVIQASAEAGILDVVFGTYQTDK
jgi:biopolymer transport protein ExbD